MNSQMGCVYAGDDSVTKTHKRGKTTMIDLTMLQEAKYRHEEMLADAERRRRARDAAHSQSRDFRIDLGDLHISVRIGTRPGPMANASAS